MSLARRLVGCTVVGGLGRGQVRGAKRPAFRVVGRSGREEITTLVEVRVGWGWNAASGQLVYTRVMARTRSWSRTYGAGSLNEDLPPFVIELGQWGPGNTVQSVIVDLQCTGSFSPVETLGDSSNAPWSNWVSTVALQWVPNVAAEPAPTGYYSGPVLLSDSFPWVQQINFQTDSYVTYLPGDDPPVGTFTYRNTAPSELIRSKAMRLVAADSSGGAMYLIVDRQAFLDDETGNFFFDFVYSAAVLVLSAP